MALRGNLRDFSLPDVFQLVTFSKKTGVLRIRRADGVEGSVWFRDGDVFFAQSNWHREPLGERMVKAQRITQNALTRALEVRASEGASGRRLGTILVDEGYVSEKVLEAFVQEQIQDTIFDLMRWDEGEFDFEELPELAEEDIGLSVSIENVVMEGARRLEEWARIKKKVPSMDIVFKMATAPGEGTFEISLKPIEWQLLLLVDGTRSVAELAVHTGRTDFEVARIIYGLFSAGLLEIAADDEVAKLREERGVREERLAAIRRETDLTVEARSKRPAHDVQASAEEPAPPAEEPSFLSAGAQSATAEDMAVFEQMMGAVLEAPAEEVPAEEPSIDTGLGLGFEPEEAFTPEAAPESEIALEPEVPETPPEPEAPAPEPEQDLGAFMDVPEAPAEVTSAFPAVAETPPPEDLFAGEVAPAEPEAPAYPKEFPGLAPEAPPEPEPEAVAGAEASASADLLDLLAATGGGAVETVAEQPPAEPVSADIPELSGDLERDLMSLGLGELPTEMAAEPAAPPAEVPEGLPDHEMLLMGGAPEVVVEPAEPEAEATETLEYEEAGIEPAEELAAAEEEPEAVLPMLEDVEPEPEAEPDFTDLLSSLEGGAEEPPAVVTGVVSAESPGGVDEVSTGSTGVISTDAFLDEIGGDMDLGTGLGDELSALTGGGGGGRPRPAATVKKIPERGEAGGLHMDQIIDKDLVMRLIDGIKDL